MPSHGRGQRIGLFGGSFDPVHAGHLLVAETALARCRLDAIWWLVTPGNPLKDTGALPDARQRMAAIAALARDPRMVVTDIEARLGTRYTADTIARLAQRAPATRFVWVMGADGLAGFHRWDRWRDIARLVPICIVDRPGQTFRAAASLAAHALAHVRIDEADAATLADREPPAWTLLHGPRTPISSTALRTAR